MTASKILVADDSLTIRKLVETVLCQDGYEVITAETGGDCLALALSEKPCLILLDYILPDMQGTEVCRSLINSPDTWEIPVLMMSSNGNAIRQLYQDLNNVADYLTKPFAPNVLKAVVGHLLQRESPSTSLETGVPDTRRAGGLNLSSDLMDKVTRLIGLMENNSGQIDLATAAAVVKAQAGTNGHAAPKKARRVRKPVASVPAPDVVVRKFRRILLKHMRSRAAQIPEWEASRGTADAEKFFGTRLLSRAVLDELSRELWKATGAPAEGKGALRCPTSLIPMATLFTHLHSIRATGELQIELEEETVLVCFENGEVVLTTTNHARNYCTGSTYDFQAVSHEDIGEAVRAQEEQSLPFFVSLKNSGNLAAGTPLEELLKAQGERCLVRAFKATDSTITFYPLTKLPPIVRSCRYNVPLNQLLLACYRAVDDWFTLEQVFPNMEATLTKAPDANIHLPGLSLSADESRLWEAVRDGRTISELGKDVDLKPFEICQISFPFVKLGFLNISGGEIAAQNKHLDPAPAKAPQPEVPSDLSEQTDPGTALLDKPAEVVGEMEPAVEAALPPALPEESPAVSVTTSGSKDAEVPLPEIPATVEENNLVSSKDGVSSPTSENLMVEDAAERASQTV